MDIGEIEAAIRNAWHIPERFQQLTDEDRKIFGEPGLVFLNPPISGDSSCAIKRQNWLAWRAAPYPAERHSEYLFRVDDLNTGHPRILVSAVLDVATGVDQYLAQFNKKQRYQVTGRKAANAGFTTRIINPAEHAGEIWDIIHSSYERQGRGIAKIYDTRPRDHDFPEYLDFVDPNYKDICIGGFSPDGRMVAYILGKRVGDHVQYDEIMGHAEFVATQVMFLVHFAFIEEVLQQETIPKCLNYGPWYSGVNPFSSRGGLNFWKRKTRFCPAYLITAFS